VLRKLRSAGGEPSYRAALAHFVTAARSGRPAHPDLLDGYRSLAVITAAEESAATGRTTAVPDREGEGAAGQPAGCSTEDAEVMR